MKNKGTAKIIQNYLEKNIGLKFTVSDINKKLNFENTNSSVTSKINHLYINEKLEKQKIGSKVYYTVKQEIINGTKSKNTTQEYLPVNPQHQHIETLNSPPLDVAGLMHHITQIDQQNILYRNILEQIALLLEQAQIFERIK